jgi:hypothetical protein
MLGFNPTMCRAVSVDFPKSPVTCSKPVIPWNTPMSKEDVIHGLKDQCLKNLCAVNQEGLERWYVNGINLRHDEGQGQRTLNPLYEVG